jgi:dTDP-4-amino-4,6-dideoxygalactose transaminase
MHLHGTPDVTELLALHGGPPVRTLPFPPWPVFGAPEEARLLATLRSGNWGRLDGSQVEEFERRFAALHGCRHGIGVSNGTVSLRIALLAAGVSAGDEVIVPPYTFISTASAVVEANAIPVFADIDPHTFNLDPAAIEAAVTPRTRAIIPVHFAGLVADMDAILAIARDRKLVVIEDAAHAHAASQSDRPAGSFGHLASFSFQSSKNLTSGEGGLIVTNDDHLAARCRSIQNCGRVEGGVWYEHHAISGNYRLGEFQGAMLNAQLERLQEQTDTRDANGRYLACELKQLPGISVQARDRSCTRHAYHLFMMLLEPEFGGTRDRVVAALEAEGIPCSAGYAYPLHRQPLFRNRAFGPYLAETPNVPDYAHVVCPNAERICEHSVWLEQHLLLGTAADMDDIVTAFHKIYEHRAAL